MHIKIDDLTGFEIHELLQEHLASMRVHSPPESVHALPIEGLRRPEITFWSVWENGDLLGCGALKELDSQHGEIVQLAHRRDATEASVLSCNFAGDGAHGATLVILDETRTLEKREGNAHPDFTRLEKAY